MFSTMMAVACLFLRHYYKTIWKKDHFSKDTAVVLFYKYKEVTSDSLDRYDPHTTTMWSF